MDKKFLGKDFLIKITDGTAFIEKKLFK